jgi:hypothetical protein
MSCNSTQKTRKNLFGKRKDQEFFALMQAAPEDQTIRQHLFALLAPSSHRWLSQLQKCET